VLTVGSDTGAEVDPGGMNRNVGPRRVAPNLGALGGSGGGGVGSPLSAGGSSGGAPSGASLSAI
jgi:hypothetical protein